MSSSYNINPENQVSQLYFQDEDSILKGLKQHKETQDISEKVLEFIARKFANTRLEPPINLKKHKIEFSFSESIKIRTALLACTVLKNNKTDQKGEMTSVSEIGRVEMDFKSEFDPFADLPKLTFSDEDPLLQGLKQHKDTKALSIKLLEKIAKFFANSTVKQPINLDQFEIDGMWDKINIRKALEACAVNKKNKTDQKERMTTPSFDPFADLPKLTFSDEDSLLRYLKQHGDTKDISIKLLEKIAKFFANSTVKQPINLDQFEIDGLWDKINLRKAL